MITPPRRSPRPPRAGIDGSPPTRATRRNNAAGPTACDDAAETAIVRQAAVDPVATAFSTTASPSPQLGAPLYDVAHLRGGLDPGGTITFELFGPDDQSCTGPPAFTATVLANGNGDYRSAVFIVPQPGTYRWVASYSGDIGNAAAGPTACADSAESAVVGPDPGLTPIVAPTTGPTSRPVARSPHTGTSHPSRRRQWSPGDRLTPTVERETPGDRSSRGAQWRYPVGPLLALRAHGDLICSRNDQIGTLLSRFRTARAGPAARPPQ